MWVLGSDGSLRQQMVTELGKALEGRVEVVPCMVDRICVDRTISPDKIDVRRRATWHQGWG